MPISEILQFAPLAAAALTIIIGAWLTARSRFRMDASASRDRLVNYQKEMLDMAEAERDALKIERDDLKLHIEALELRVDTLEALFKLVERRTD